MRLLPDDVMSWTLKRFLLHYDAYCLESWDHTAAITAMLHNLIATVANTAQGSKTRIKPVSMQDMHPYRKTSSDPSRKKITARNISTLRLIAGNLYRSK